MNTDVQKVEPEAARCHSGDSSQSQKFEQPEKSLDSFTISQSKLSDMSTNSRAPMAHEWVWAAKVASRAQVVLSAWNGPGEAEGDQEALETLREFAKQFESKESHMVNIACEMLLGSAMKPEELAMEAWSGMVDEAVSEVENHEVKEYLRIALRADHENYSWRVKFEGYVECWNGGSAQPLEVPGAAP